MKNRNSRPKLGPYEHIFSGSTCCILCGWPAPARLPAGTHYGRGARTFAGEAELHQSEGEPLYTGLIEVPGFVIDASSHAGWIDWDESLAPLCAHAQVGAAPSIASQSESPS